MSFLQYDFDRGRTRSGAVEVAGIHAEYSVEYETRHAPVRSGWVTAGTVRTTGAGMAAIVINTLHRSKLGSADMASAGDGAWRFRIEERYASR